MPVKLGNGSNVTTPVAGFMLQVPSLATTMFEVVVHDASAVEVAQIFTLVEDSGYVVPPTAPAVSLAMGVNV